MKKNRTSIFLLLAVLVIISPLASKSKQCVWTGVKKIVAIGDLHGDYKSFEKIIIGTGLVDDNLVWIGGKTHLVQTGDIMDRGPDAKKIFDLIKILEKDAEEKGGRVHMLIGNHEEMNITGIAFGYQGYISPEQYVSFLPGKYIESIKKKQVKKFAKLDNGGMNSDSLFEEYFDNYLVQVIRNTAKYKAEQKKYTNSFNDTYGKWIIEHNAVIKINDTIFIHGGISKKYSSWKLERINDLLRSELTYFRLVMKGVKKNKEYHDIVYGEKSPLWYRELAQESGKVFKKEVETILQNLRANHMVIAHHPLYGGSPLVAEEFMKRLDGKIWAIDTSISEYMEGGYPSALIIENGKFEVFGIIDK